MVATVGTPNYRITDASGSETGSSASFTPPTGCNCMVVFWGNWGGSACNIDSLNWNSSETFTLHVNKDSSSGQGFGVATLANPTITSSTIDWDWGPWTTTIGWGGHFTVIFVEDASITSDLVDIADVDSDYDGSGGSDAASITLTPAAADLPLGMGANLFSNPTLDYDTIDYYRFGGE